MKAVSFGGGEPLQYPGWFDILERLRGRLFRSMTSNGLMLDMPGMMEQLADAAPEKIHLSIHFPDRDSEVERVFRQVRELQSHGIRSGVNLLVANPHLDAAQKAAAKIRAAGIGNDRIVYLPMRVRDTPTPAEMAKVAGVEPGVPFQSMSCLTGCEESAIRQHRLGQAGGVVFLHGRPGGRCKKCRTAD